ncbi:MAG: prephenate dehydrogenase [Anaerolineae bacterium]|nr:prephenate dehydrogenase [Anaerolineae bacterium]
MQTVNVGIIGLRRLGGSFGLALRRYNQSKDARQHFAVTGYDPDEQNAAAARTMGACDTVARSLSAAVRDRNIIVIALPLHEIEAAYQLMSGELTPGCVVLDTAVFKQPPAGWASKHLGKEAHQVGITPVVNARYLFDGLDDIDHAAEDYFDKGVILVSPGSTADPDAVQLATDFAQLIGASVRFTDPAEHDSWTSVMELLPAALGVAAFDAIRRLDHWDDVRRVGNPAFGQLTHHLLESHPDALRDALFQDRANLVRHIDQVIESLAMLRDLLSEGDRDAVEALLVQTRDAFAEWLGRRRTGEWDPTHKMERDGAASSLMTGLFGSAITKRLKRGGDDDT